MQEQGTPKVTTVEEAVEVLLAEQGRQGGIPTQRAMRRRRKTLAGERR